MPLSDRTRKILRDLDLVGRVSVRVSGEAYTSVRALHYKLEQELAVEVKVNFAKAELGLPADYIEQVIPKRRLPPYNPEYDPKT